MYQRVTLEDAETDQIMVINGQDLWRNPAKTISAVQDFMNLEQVIKEENFVTIRKRKKRSEIPKKVTHRKMTHLFMRVVIFQNILEEKN